MQPGSIVEVTINCRAVTKTGVWRSYTVGQQFTVISTDEKEAKLRDFCGQVVLMPLGRLQLVESQPGPNIEGPGEPGPRDEREWIEQQTQEAIGAFMADRSDLERAEAFREFTAGLLDERVSRTWKEHEYDPFSSRI